MPNKYRQKLTNKGYQRAIKLYKTGISLREVSRQFNISFPALRKGFRKRNVKIVPFSQKIVFSKKEQAEIKKAYKDGETAISLRNRFNVSQPTMERILDDLGLRKKRQMHSTKKWTYQKVIKKIKRLSKKIGKTPTAYEMNVKGQPGIHSLLKKFGKTWNNLLKDAGITPNIEYGVWTKKKLKNQFLELLDKKAVIPSKNAIEESEELPSSRVIRSLFSDFGKFFKYCGIKALSKHLTWYQWEKCCEEIAMVKFGSKAVETQVTDKYVKGRPDIIIKKKRLIIDAMTTPYVGPLKLKQIKDFSKGYKLEFWCLFRHGRKHKDVKYRYANELINTKGLKPRTKKIIKELSENFYSETFLEQLLAGLREIYENEGVIPIAKKLPNYNLPTWLVYKNAFGSFENARKLAGIPVKPLLHRHTNEELMQCLNELYKTHNEPISDKLIRKKCNIDRRTFIKRFGSIESACNKANLPFTNRIYRLGKPKNL